MEGSSLRLWLTLLAGAATLLLPDPRIDAQTPASPIQAELVKRLDADKVRLGDSVLTRVQLGWKSPSCDLRPGDILQARIVLEKPYSKTDKTSEIALLFEKGQCSGASMKPLALTVASIVSADRGRDPSLQPSEEHQSLSDAVGLTLHGNARSVSQAADTVYNEPGRTVYVSPTRSAPPKELKAGQVVGISHLKLFVGQGPEGASVLSSTGRELHLAAGTQFVLFAEASAGAGASPKNVSGPSTPGQPPDVQPSFADPPKIADETEVCAPPSCQVVVNESSSATETRDAELVLPLKSLGYSPPSLDREMIAFDYQAGVAFLGSGHLLFTFDPHVLVKRTNSEAISSPGLRVIRAVVVDLATREIAKSVDWRVADSGQYFWPFGDEQVLVHVGDELRVYGPGLELRKRIALGGPLAFVRESPSSAVMAVGVVKERHTPEIHRQLHEAEGRQPEEDVEVRVLDANLHPITKVTRSSRQPPPVLKDDGELRKLKLGPDQWRIVKYSWDGQKRVLVQARSSCLPSAQTMPADLVFLLGCDRLTGNKWYRILRDGKVLLKGSSSSAEFEHTVNSAAAGNVFAIGIAAAKQSLPWLPVFHASDLRNERIAIYSTKTGQRILALSVSPVVPTVQMFAVSPGEKELAVLMVDKICLYGIPGGTSEH